MHDSDPVAHRDSADPTDLVRADDVTFRHFLSWKPLFYDALLPALCGARPGAGATRSSGPSAGSLATPGRRAGASWTQPSPVRARGPGSATLEPCRAARQTSEGNVLRFLARDCLLDGRATDARFFDRFDVPGVEHLDAALGRGRGVILVGSHLAAHLSAAALAVPPRRSPSGC